MKREVSFFMIQRIRLAMMPRQGRKPIMCISMAHVRSGFVDSITGDGGAVRKGGKPPELGVPPVGLFTGSGVGVGSGGIVDIGGLAFGEVRDGRQSLCYR